MSEERGTTPEDLFGSVGPQALRFLVSSVRSRDDAAKIMEVGTGTVSRWMAEVSTDGKSYRTYRSHRSVWAGYPSPLPAYDRVYERLVGKTYLDFLFRRSSVEEALSGLRSGGLSLLQAGTEEEVLAACRSMQIPSSSRRRWLCTDWPTQWTALDRLSTEVCGKGWPEFVLSYEPGRAKVELPAPALAALSEPLLRSLSRR